MCSTALGITMGTAMKWAGAFVLIVAAVFSGMYLYERHAAARAKEAIHDAFVAPEEVWGVATAKITEIIGAPLEFQKLEQHNPQAGKLSVQRWKGSWSAAGVYRRTTGTDDWHTFLVKLTDSKEFKGATLRDSDPSLSKYWDSAGDIYVIAK